MDCRKDVCMGQSQSPSGPRLRTLRNNRFCLHSPCHDPHHAQATCRKRLVMNPNFSDGLLDALAKYQCNLVTECIAAEAQALIESGFGGFGEPVLGTLKS